METAYDFFSRNLSRFPGPTECGGYAVAVLIFLGLILFFLFIWAFRRNWRAMILTVLMVVFGCWVYSRDGMTKPSNLSADQWSRPLAISDNTLGSFFMSRGSYDDFESGDATDAADANRLPARKDPSAAARRDAETFFYYLFHALCYVYGLAFLFTVFGRRIVNMICLVFGVLPLKFWRRPVMVFWGVGPESLAAANAAVELKHPFRHPLRRKRGYPVFAIPETKAFAFRRETTPQESLLDERHFPWLYVDPVDFSGLGSPFLLCAREHYFLGPDGQSNVALANALLERLRREVFPGRLFRLAGIHPRNPTIYLRIDADAEEDVLFQWADRQAKSGSADIILVHEPSLVASGLLREHPMLDAPGISVHPESCTVSGSFRVLLVGCGAQGRAILRETVQDAVFPGRAVSFSAIVVDADSGAFEPFKSFWDALPKKQTPSDSTGGKKFLIDNSDPDDPAFPASFDFRAFDVRSPAFRHWVAGQVAEAKRRGALPWNRVVAALPDDLDNLRLVSFIERECRIAGLFDAVPPDDRGKPLFFAGIRRPGNVAYCSTLLSGSEPSAPIQGSTGSIPALSDLTATFGSLNAIYSNLGGNMAAWDAGARKLNWVYWKRPAGKGADERAWRKTGFFDKESSRAAVAGMRRLVRLLGFDADETASATGSARSAGLDGFERELRQAEYDPTKMRRLAQTEHLRWNAFHLMRSIRPWMPEGVDLATAAVRLHSARPDPKEQIVKENDRRAHARHAALVRFGDLPKVADRFRSANAAAGHVYETMVDRTDENFVRDLPEILETAGWSFRKCGNVQPATTTET